MRAACRSIRAMEIGSAEMKKSSKKKKKKKKAKISRGHSILPKVALVASSIPREVVSQNPYNQAIFPAFKRSRFQLSIYSSNYNMQRPNPFKNGISSKVPDFGEIFHYPSSVMNVFSSFDSPMALVPHGLFFLNLFPGSQIYSLLSRMIFVPSLYPLSMSNRPIPSKITHNFIFLSPLILEGIDSPTILAGLDCPLIYVSQLIVLTVLFLTSTEKLRVKLIFWATKMLTFVCFHRKIFLVISSWIWSPGWMISLFQRLFVICMSLLSIALFNMWTLWLYVALCWCSTSFFYDIILVELGSQWILLRVVLNINVFGGCCHFAQFMYQELFLRDFCLFSSCWSHWHPVSLEDMHLTEKPCVGLCKPSGKYHLVISLQRSCMLWQYINYFNVYFPGTLRLFPTWVVTVKIEVWRLLLFMFLLCFCGVAPRWSRILLRSFYIYLGWKIAHVISWKSWLLYYSSLIWELEWVIDVLSIRFLISMINLNWGNEVCLIERELIFFSNGIVGFLKLCYHIRVVCIIILIIYCEEWSYVAGIQTNGFPGHLVMLSSDWYYIEENLLKTPGRLWPPFSPFIRRFLSPAVMKDSQCLDHKGIFLVVIFSSWLLIPGFRMMSPHFVVYGKTIGTISSSELLDTIWTFDYGRSWPLLDNTMPFNRRLLLLLMIYLSVSWVIWHAFLYRLWLGLSLTFLVVSSLCWYDLAQSLVEMCCLDILHLGLSLSSFYEVLTLLYLGFYCFGDLIPLELSWEPVFIV